MEGTADAKAEEAARRLRMAQADGTAVSPSRQSIGP